MWDKGACDGITLVVIFTLAAVIVLLSGCEPAAAPKCADHIPDPTYHGVCENGARLVVEDHVAVCRCPKGVLP